jgi:hypothetical protein
MKRFLLLSLLPGLLPLAGCGVSANLAAVVGVAATAGTVATIQRTHFDAVYSLLTGRDCSMVRQDEGKTYCRPVEPEPEPPPFCTRSLGAVDCWQDRGTVPGQPRGVADGPSVLTPAQEADRVRTWP